MEFMDLYNLIYLIKTTTYFKGTGYLTNQKYLFKNTNAFETGLSDHYLLIYSMLKIYSISEKWPKKTGL